MNILIIIIFLMVTIFIVYYLTKNKSNKQLLNIIPLKQKNKFNENILVPWKTSNKYLQQLQKEHKHKIKENKKEDFFTEFGTFTRKPINLNLQKLKNLNRKYQLRNSINTPKKKLHLTKKLIKNQEKQSNLEKLKQIIIK